MAAAVNLCTPFYEPGKRITGHASAAITGKRFLKVSGNRTNDIRSVTDSVAGGNIQVAPADANGRIIGVAEQDAASGAKVGVLGVPGWVLPVTADGAIAAFEEVMVGATGKAKALATGGIPVGVAVTAAADGTDAQILLYSGGGIAKA